MITFYQQMQEFFQAYNITDAVQIASCKRWYNQGAKKVKNRLRRQVSAEEVTTNLVAEQQAYQLPEYISRVFGVKYNKAGVERPLIEVSSIYKWDMMNSAGSQTGDPTHYHLKGEDEVELWPIPSEAVDNGLLVRGNNRHQRLTADDVTSGTATVATDDSTVTLSENVVTPAWVGRFFSITDGSHEYSYKIAEYIGANSFELENYYAGDGGSGKSYLVGEIVDIPEEYLDLPALYTESRYVSVYRKNRSQGNDMMAEFKQGIKELNEDFANPSKSRVIKGSRHRVIDSPYPQWWPMDGLS